MIDPLGTAIVDYYNGKKNIEIIVHSNICEDDIMPTDYLFRDFKQMPKIEQHALKSCVGKTLDIGAGAGCHAEWLIKKGISVDCLDNSPLICKHLKDNIGVENVFEVDFFDFEGETYDTILMLMNGIGIAGELANLDAFFKKIKTLMHKDSKLLIDSSDLVYLYEEEDGSIDIDLNANYYGEVEYSFEYDKVKGENFKWLYLDQELLKEYTENYGLKIESIIEGEHYDYLAVIKLSDE